MKNCVISKPVTILKVASFVFSFLAFAAPVSAADIDIYGPPSTGGGSNAIFLLDNTSNWSSNNQNWNAKDSWTTCQLGTPSADDLDSCKSIITNIYYPSGTKKKPWESSFNSNCNVDNACLTQGQVQLRALKLVLNALICNNTDNPIKVNVGLAMIGTTGSVLNNGHSTGFIRQAVNELVGPYSEDGTNTCTTIINDLDNIDSKITDPTFKAPANANYGSAMYEIFKYFGGYSNPALSSLATPTAGAPVSSSGYGLERFSKINVLDDPNAFTDQTNRLTYKSPISSANSCPGNYLVLVGNGYPNAEPTSNGGPVVFNGIGYTPPIFSSVTSDTSRYADEWSYFLANTDVSVEPGTQSIKTYTVNTYKDKPSTDQAKLLKSMAAQGGIGPAGYLEVGGDLVGLVEAFKAILTNIAAKDSVFTAATLPVSTTTQGTYLNQVFIGMFKPDANRNPRWTGNLKQYKLGFTNGILDMLDASSPAKNALVDGFFSPSAKSYWTTDSVFFDAYRLGTPAIASDSPDGKVVEKGGAAEMLRNANLQNATNRKIYTRLPSSTDTALSATPFSYTNVSSYFSSDVDWVNWIRGENNVTAGQGKEDFIGSYLSDSTITPLPSTGARASMHGDVLHSRPIALNYGSNSSTGGVVVYYGSNDGYFHAVDGNQTGDTAGQELWSFIPPEFYSTSSNNLFERLHDGSPLLQLPENNSSGAKISATSDLKEKQYGMDGPIGTYARYEPDGTSLLEAIIYPTMRRGGSAVYAFDVTSKTNPLFKWKITNSTTGFENLGQTWSLPIPILLDSSTDTFPVLLIMGGGYDATEDNNGSSTKGKAIYVINGRTGALIKSFATDHPVPSDVALVDINRDGKIDRGYVADVRGNLYRFDFPSADADKLTVSGWSGIVLNKIASLDGKVFFPPDVLVTKNFVAVMLGTGDREKPLLKNTTDNFFLIKDTLGNPRQDSDGDTEVLTKSDLTRVAKMTTTSSAPTPGNVASSVSDDEGCYLELATNGEKVINAPLTVAGVTYFSTNRPTPENANQCSADLGEAYAYQFPLFCKAPSSPEKIDGGGLAPNPVAGVVVIDDVNGNPQKVEFLIGSGKDGLIDVNKPTPVVAPKRSRLYWRIDNANR